MTKSPPPNWTRGSWPAFEPKRRPPRHHPHGVPQKPWCLVVAVYNDSQPGMSTMQLYDAFTGAVLNPTWVTYPESRTTGLAGSPTQGTFYAQDTFSLRDSRSTDPPITQAQPSASGAYLPEFGLNSIVYNSDDQYLYVQGNTQTEVGILQYPPIPGAAPPANPMYLAGIASAESGMGLYQDGNGDSVLILPQFEGVSVCPLTEGGASVPPQDLGPIPYSAFQGISLPNGLCGPRQGPDGNLYFLTFADDPADGTGIISVDPTTILGQLEAGTPLGSLVIPVTVIVSVGDAAAQNALPYNGTGAFTVGPAGASSPQDSEALIYYTVGAWDANGDPVWSVQTITTAGAIQTLIGPQPGIAGAVCLQWM